MPDVTLRGISKSFGPVEILRDIDLEVKDGEFCVFVGPSGCGKTTLLRIIAGLETVSAGELSIGGRRVNELAPAERRIAMVFQSYALYPHMTVYRNIAFGLKFSGGRKAEVDAKVRRTAEILHLTPLLNRKPRDLSGGQRQRVAIGRAIVREPSVFLFDEPLSNLDAALRVNTRIEIAKLHRQLAATMIYVTHDQVEAMTLASKIVVLNHGRIEQAGAPLELYHRPQNLFVAGFIGSPKMNLIKGRVTSSEGQAARIALADGSQTRLANTGAALAPGQEVTLGIRPEHMAAGSGGLVPVTGSVDAVERLGEASYVYMSLAEGTNVTLRIPGDSPVEPGARLTASAASGAVHLFDADGQALAHITSTG
jgi:multiple sugar transport system ATP-binding protein